MTSMQKVIKYVAITVAILLILAIFSTILGVLRIFTGFSPAGSTTKDTTDTYPIAGEIESLTLTVHSAAISITTGDTAEVTSNLKNLSVEVEDGELTIKETTPAFFSVDRDAHLTLTLPKEISLEESTITAGAGALTMDALTTKELFLSLGAGKATLQNLTVTEEFSLDGGAGEVHLLDSTVSDLDFSVGVGNVVVRAALLGDSEINAGVSSLDLTLLGDKEEYAIALSKGLGSAKIDGSSVSTETIYGSGPNTVTIEGGVGSIAVSFLSQLPQGKL